MNKTDDLNLKRFSLIDSNTREELSRIQTETKEIIRKLENNEFQIAVVGLESSTRPVSTLSVK